jgi:uncharacterized membrane protein
MFCHHCGSQVPNDVQFCTTCGQSLAAAAPLSASSSTPWIAPSGVRAQIGRWIGEGWRLVKADIGTFILIALLFSLLNSMVPIIIQGPLFIGFHIFCMKKILARNAQIGDLFSGFSFFVPGLVASLLISLLTSLGFLLCIIPGLVVAAMYKFTYLFILDKRMDFWPAMQSSHSIAKQDYFGFTMFLLALIGIDILGVLCCFIGVFVTIPVTIAAITVAYQEIVGFDPRTVESLG